MRHLGQKLLVIILGVVERRRFQNLRRDAAVAGLSQRRGKPGLRGICRAALRIGIDIDAGAVLRADIVALAHPLGRVVRLPEDLEQHVVGHPGRVENGHDHLVVPGAPGADILIGRVRCVTARIADRGGPHTRQFPELALGAPEAAEPEQRALHALGEGRCHRLPVDEMLGQNRHDPVAVRQRPIGTDHLDLLHQVEKHRGGLCTGETTPPV